MQTLITVRSKRHGTYQCEAASLDIMIMRYLPATLAELNVMLNERHGTEPGYFEAQSLTEALMILAELDGYATN